MCVERFLEHIRSNVTILRSSVNESVGITSTSEVPPTIPPNNCPIQSKQINPSLCLLFC